MHPRRRGRNAEGQGDLGDLSAEGTPLQAGERVVQSEYAETLTYISQHGDAALYTRSARRHPRRLHEGAWRLHHAPGPDLLQDRRARADPGRLSRLADPRAAAARRLRRAHRADAEYSGGLRYRGARLRHRRDHPLSRRSAEDRLCRPRRRQRRSGFCRRAGAAADLEGLCRGSAAARSTPAVRRNGAPAWRSSRARTPRT